MGVEIARRKDGTLRSKWWYGRFTVNGKTKCVNLDIEICGKIPITLRQTGNAAFERSRLQAQLKLEELVRAARSRKTAEHHLQELYELKADAELHQADLTELEALWDRQPVKKPRSAQWIQNQHSALKAYREFIQEQYPHVQYMAQATASMAEAWMRTYDARKLSAETYNHRLILLRGLFVPSSCSGVLRNPFAGIPPRLKRNVHRQPFSPEELKEILKHCDEILRPVFVTGMCTAMRRGDCCLLKWESVDLANSFVTVKTSKTGEVAEIPLFPLLRVEIEKQQQGNEYVFQDAAEMYLNNPTGISWRMKQALKAAKIKTTLDRGEGAIKASVKDFHSLRTTWITMALSGGVPMELVRRVTGHSTVNIVLKHYFRPNREDFREALTTALPHMLTGGAEKKKSPSEEIQALIAKADGMEKDALIEELAKIAKQLAT